MAAAFRRRLVGRSTRGRTGHGAEVVARRLRRDLPSGRCPAPASRRGAGRWRRRGSWPWPGRARRADSRRYASTASHRSAGASAGELTTASGDAAAADRPARPGSRGSSSAFWRSRSQNGSAPRVWMKSMGRLARPDLDPVADPQRDVLAPVDAQQGVVGGLDAQPHDVLWAHDARAQRRQVGGDGRDDEVAARRAR